VRICIAYDCLYPWTVGGAERWCRSLAERLAQEGHEVTYITRRQWREDNPPDVPGVRVVCVSHARPLYGPSGRRTIGEPLTYGWGVLGHLLRAGREYDVVHAASFPYFSVLAAAAARPLCGYRLIVDWLEVWSDSYWRGYLGALGGRIGRAVQRACVRVDHRAFCFSTLHRDRLLAEGFRGHISVLGAYAGDLTPPEPNVAQPVVVFAGRHIPPKRAPAVVPAVMRARRAIPGLRGVVFGDGPQRPDLLRAIAAHQADEIIAAPGFVAEEDVAAAVRDALCMLLPSSREGHGLVVVEASAHGTPSIVVAGEDNAAVELVEEGRNGTIAASASAQDLAAAIERIHRGGPELRARTCAWFAEHAARLSLEQSLQQILAAYGDGEKWRQSEGDPRTIARS